MLTSVLVLIGAAAAEAFTGTPALSGLRSGPSSLQMAQAAPPASGKALPQAKIEALEVNLKQWNIKTEGAAGTQAPPPESGNPLPQAKTEALEVNQKQWGIGASSSLSGQGPPPETGKPLCKAKVEAAEVNQKQWGIGAGAAPAAANADEMEPVVIEPGVDYIAKLEALSSKYMKKLEAV